MLRKRRAAFLPRRSGQGLRAPKKMKSSPLLHFVAWLLALCCLAACPPTSPKAPKPRQKTTKKRSSLDVFPVLSDQRWAWGAGAPTLLLKGDFNKDGKEDALIVSEPLVQHGRLREHFTLFAGPGRSPEALQEVKLVVSPKHKGFRWGTKTLAVTEAHAADVDKDGHLDVVVAYRVGRVALFKGSKGGRRFTLHQVWSSEGKSLFVAPQLQLVDWDGDGRLDLIIGGAAPSLSLWRQGANGTFVPQMIAQGAGQKLSLAALTQQVRQWPASPKAPTPRPKLAPKKSPAARPKPAPKKALAARPKPASRPVPQPVSRPSARSAPPVLRQAAKAAAPLTLPQWTGTKGLQVIDVKGDGRPELILAGVDPQNQLRLWVLSQEQRDRVRGQGGWRLLSTHFVSGQWPSEAPIRGHKLAAAPLAHTSPELLMVTSVFGSLNLRGIGLMHHYQRGAGQQGDLLGESPSANDAKVNQKALALDGPGSLVMWENAISFGLATGRFGAQGERGVVLYGSYQLLGFAPDKRTFRFSLRDDPIVGGRLSLRSAIGVDLNGDGHDALVMLSVGALNPNNPLGVQLIILKKPLF